MNDIRIILKLPLQKQSDFVIQISKKFIKLPLQKRSNSVMQTSFIEYYTYVVLYNI